MQKWRRVDLAAAVQLLRNTLTPDANLEVVQAARDHVLTEVKVELQGLGTLRLVLVPEIDPTPGRSGRDQAVPVLVIRTRRTEERERLRRTNRNFIDLSGAVHIRAGGLYLDREDLEPVPTNAMDRIDPYSDRASRVARTLLTASRDHRWTTKKLAAEARVDVSTASRAIRELRRRSVVEDESPGQGRSSRIWVPDGEALLRDWSRSYRWTDNRQLRLAAPIGSPRRFLSRMPEFFEGRQWALALQAGASLVAPHAKFEIVHAYVDTTITLEETALQRGWEPSPEGNLCLLKPLYRESVWFQDQLIKRIPVTGTVQLVLDLWHYPDRGREQAGRLIDTVLRPVWEFNVEQD